MLHDHHPAAPGHLPRAILQDNCDRCDQLVKRGIEGLQHLPHDEFVRLWQLMLRPGLKPDASGSDLIACGELCAMARALERHAGVDRHVLSIAMMARLEEHGNSRPLSRCEDPAVNRLRDHVRALWGHGQAGGTQ